MKRKTLWRYGAVTLTALSMMSLGVAQAHAGNIVSETESSVEAITQSRPDVLDGAQAVSLSDATEATIGLSKGSIVVPANPENPLTFSVGNDTVEVSLPEAENAILKSTSDAAVTYDNLDGSSTVVVGNQDSSLTVLSVIDDPAAPDSFTYTYGAAEVRQAEDGGVTFWDNGEFTGFLLTPWAVDASGNEVATRYEVTGNSVTQIVEHKGMGYSYPIVADPTQYLGGNSVYSNINLVIDSAAATTIVSVTPAPNINWNRMTRSSGIPPYDALVPSTYEANKYHDQLVCHWVNAGYAKTPWNLDSWRPDVGYAATVAALCNP